jgi:hypothetical protein
MIYSPAIATIERLFIKIVDVDYHQKDKSAIQIYRFWGVLGEIRPRAPVAKAEGRVDIL